jgi:ubiquinone/menaquinone biosynthesis C-methylase UbiE
MTQDMHRFYDHEAERKKWGETLVGEGLFRTEARLIERYFRPGESVLDVGCGGGREAFALATLRLSVTAVDYTPAFVETCARNARERGLAIRVLQADAAELPFDDEAFDHVVMIGQLLGHVRPRERRLRVLREIRRVMKPGVALVSTNSVERRLRYRAYFAVANLVRAFHNPHGFEPFDAFVRRIGGEPSAGPDRLIFHWYRTRDFLRDAREAGWEVVELARRWKFEKQLADPSTSGETFYALRKGAR